MTRQIDCINLFSKMMRNMFELLYKDRSEIYKTSNKEEIRKIIDNTVNDTEIINIQNEFKKYTPTEGKKLLSDLEICLTQKANAIKSEENLNLMHLNIVCKNFWTIREIQVWQPIADKMGKFKSKNEGHQT